MIVLDLSFSVLILNFSGLKSSKLTNFAGVAHNVLSILHSFTLFILYYLKKIPPLENFTRPVSGFTCHLLSFTYKHSSK